jgi:exopolysaccharide biosynthesis polyprenyl glycosylphosphotransferase
MALLVVRNYFAREEDLSRLLYPVALVLVTGALVAGRGLLQAVIVRYFVGKSLPRTRMLIVGTGPTAIRLAARLLRHPEYAYELAGFVCSPGDADSVGKRLGGVPVLGTVDQLRAVLQSERVQELFVAQSEIPHDSFLRLFLESEMETVRVNVIPNVVEMMRSKIFYDEIAGVPIYTLQETPLQGWNFVLKRVVDVVLSLAALAVLSPLLPVVALLIKRGSPGPVFYAQERLGLDGERFRIYKFRTMPVGAEKDGPAWGVQDDPRAFAFGRLLRRWNIDELPQLLNVLRGEMSLVGPRPERPHYVDQFKRQLPRYMARHKVRAGMTGWAQVHGLRGDSSVSQRLRYDLYYIENWSIWLDLKILIMTFFQPRGRRRAYRLAHLQHAPLDDAPPNATTEDDSPCPIPPALSMEKPPGSPARAGG